MAVKKQKDWFDQSLAKQLAKDLKSQHSIFNSRGFVRDVSSKLEPLELKARISVFAEALHRYLPDDYGEATDIILACLGDENPEETGMFTEYFWIMPYATFVEIYGLDDPETSLKAIAAITKRNTGEYAIRPFLERYPERTFAQMLDWSQDENFHLRRLASEGTRPRLPWAKKLTSVIDDPELSLPILENLKDDPIRFVQKSVANHINDHFKDNGEFAMQLLQAWKKGAGPERRWIIRHALRSERKKGNPVADKITTEMAAKK